MIPLRSCKLYRQSSCHLRATQHYFLGAASQSFSTSSSLPKDSSCHAVACSDTTNYACKGIQRVAPAPASLSMSKTPTLMKEGTRRAFTTAYQGTPGDGKHNYQRLTNLIPYQSTLKDGRRVEVDFFRHSPTDIEEDEYFAGMALMNLVIREGRSWPFDEEFREVEAWSGYFLSHTAFVVRALDNGMDAAKRNSSSQGEILGCFYIKPNFPGRCSHVCNGGFITAPRFRGLGIGRLMGNVFLRAARDLGYKSSYFNLVFKSNVGSVKLWESLGFERVATLENAAALEGLEEGELDTAYGYRYDLEKLPKDYLGIPPQI